MTAIPVPRPVVVGVDGSADSLAAVRRGVAQAAERGTGLELVHAVPVGADAATVSGGQALLDLVVRSVAATGLCAHHAKRIVARGDPAEILAGRSNAAQLLLIGGLSQAGDVVSSCLALAACPVDICADQRAPAALAGGPRGGGNEG